MAKTKQITFTKAEKAGKRMTYTQIKEAEAYKKFKQEATKRAKAELGIDVRTKEEKARTKEYQQKQLLQKYRVAQAKQRGLKEARKQVFTEQLQRAPIRTTTQQLAFAEQQAQARQRKIGLMGSRAEMLEIECCNFDEVPLLKNMESQRIKMTSPPHFKMQQIEKSVTDLFPQ